VGANLLTRLRDGRLKLTPEITTALLSLVDAVRLMLKEIQSTGQDGEADYPELRERLSQLMNPGTSAAASPAGTVVPPSPPTPIETKPEQKPETPPAPCRMRDLGYGYYERQKVDLAHDPAWAVLLKEYRELEGVDLVRFTFELDEAVANIHEPLFTIFGSSTTARAEPRAHSNQKVSKAGKPGRRRVNLFGNRRAEAFLQADTSGEWFDASCESAARRR